LGWRCARISTNQHRWEILRAIWPHTNTDCYCYTGAKSNANAHADIFTYRYSDSY
jgi:hypothetical protein